MLKNPLIHYLRPDPTHLSRGRPNHGCAPICVCTQINSIGAKYQSTSLALHSRREGNTILVFCEYNQWQNDGRLEDIFSKEQMHISDLRKDKITMGLTYILFLQRELITHYRHTVSCQSQSIHRGDIGE